MASGLAVVAFDYAAAAEVIRHGESGLLAPYGDGPAFAAHAAALVGDPARARRMGERARRDALGRGWDRLVNDLEACCARRQRGQAMTNEAPAIRAPSAAPAMTSLG